MLEEGITEAGSMSSFIAAGTAYSSHGMNMIPMFIYYSMFGFQRIGDLIWAAADCAGQGLHARRHRRPHDAQRRRPAAPGRPQPAQRDRFPDRAGLRPGVRLRDGRDRLRRPEADVRGRRDGDLLHHARERKLRHARDARRACEEGIIRGMYKLSTRRTPAASTACSCSAAARSCAKRCGRRRSWPRSIKIASDVWSVTSYTQLRRDAQECQRWNMLNPREAAAAVVRRAAARRRRRAVHRRQRLRAGAGRADRPLGARRTVRAGHRRHGPQRKPRRPCGGTSRSTPSASRSPRCTSSRSRASATASASPTRSTSWASTRRSNRRCTHKNLIDHRDTEITEQKVHDERMINVRILCHSSSVILRVLRVV